MRQLLIILFLITSTTTLFSQNYSELEMDTLNKNNEEGEKTGYWAELLQDNLIITDDKSKAHFYCYAYYEKGVRKYPPLLSYSEPKFPFKLKKGILTLITDGNKSIKNEIVLLNGNYTLFWEGKEKRTKYVNYIFDKGLMQESNTYHSSNKINEHLDITKRYHNELFSYWVEIKEENGKLFYEGYGHWVLNKKGESVFQFTNYKKP
jgi:hypothetical protein